MADMSESLDSQTLQRLLALKAQLPSQEEAPPTATGMNLATEEQPGDSGDLDSRIANNKKLLSIMDNTTSEDSNKPLPQPNAGLIGNELDNAIKQNPGPVATTGFNPSVVVPSSDESKDEEESPDTNPASILTKLKNLKENPTKNPPLVQDTLAKLLGQNREDLAGANDQRNQLQLLAMLGHAGAQAGAALTPLAHTMPDNTAFNALMQAAQQPVSDIKMKQDLANETMKGKVLQGQAQTEIQKTDPTSAVSKAYRDLYEKTTHKPTDPGMSAMDIEKLEPALARMSTAEENAKNRRAILQQGMNTKEEVRRDKVDQHVGDMLESSRQTPDVKQAYLDAYSASKALTLLNKYPDLNKMSNQESGLIASEVAKIAQGGVPGKEELQALKPNALPQWFASTASKLTNDPTPANAGAFLQKYKDYLTDLNKNAKDVINDKVGRVLDVNESKMNKETAKLYKDKYLKPLQDMKSNNSNAHPQDDEAVAWAKSHPENPMSTEILKANGQ